MRLLLISLACALQVAICSIPFGVNLSPLGGSSYGVSNWDPVSPYVFVDIFKHCTALYIKVTNNNGKTFSNQANSVTWRADGYPNVLSYSPSNQFVAMCDIGLGGSYVANGSYAVFWSGVGDIGFSTQSATIQQYNRTAGSAIIQVHIGHLDGLNVRIMKSNGTNPVHNVRIVPIAFSHNYTTQIFQPNFLTIVKTFSHIRFTGWQKITTSPKLWTTRNMPSYQTQHSTDGVALEHMIDLIRVTNIPSIWFSFPLASSDYNSHMASFLHDNLIVLQRNISIYYEASCGETSGDSDRHVESLALFNTFGSVFGNASIANSSYHHGFRLMPTATVTNMAYVPYLLTRFGSAYTRINAVGIPAQFGRSSQSWDHFDSYGQWDNTYAGYSQQQLLNELRTAVLDAEFEINYMRQNLLSAHENMEFVSYDGGPFFTATTYGYRAGLNTMQKCTKFPCTWSNTHYNFVNQSQLNAAMPTILLNASLEQQVQNNLITVQRDLRLSNVYMDFLERWKRLGGGLFVTSLIVRPALVCSTGGSICGNEGMFEIPSFSQVVPQYQAIMQYKAGIRSTLPFTSGDIYPQPISAQTCNGKCSWGTCFNSTCYCYAGYSGSNCDVKLSQKLNDCNNDTGINLAGVVDWSSEWPFVDMFKSSRAWISQTIVPYGLWSTSTTQYLDSNGYPRYLLPNQQLGAMMIRDLQNHMRSGVFVCLYDGDGIITFSMDIMKISRGIGRIEVTVHPSTGLNNGAFLVIQRTNPANPIRNIRFVMPGFESTYQAFPFHPLFLHSLRNYKTLRFMDWQNTNAVTNGNWSGRSTSNTTSFSGSSMTCGCGSGVSLEQMIHLSNVLGTNAWFNMPHLATDDFITNFAKMSLRLLRPDVSIYIEYSNEVWSGSSIGGVYSQLQGLKQGLSTNAVTARFCFYMQRSSQIFAIWQQIFGTSSSRLHLILNSQASNADVSRQMLACPSMTKIDRKHTSLAIAPYFGSYSPSTNLNFNVFMNTTLPSQIQALFTTAQVLGHVKWARLYNMSVVTYESGQGLHGSGQASDFAIQANRDSRMTGLYISYFNQLRSSGIKLMMQFSSTGLYSTSATWGLVEAQDQDPLSSPKYLGLQSYISQHSSCSISSQKLLDTVPTCPLGCSLSGVCVAGVGGAPNHCECYYGSSGAYCQNTTYTEHVDLCGYKCGFNQGMCVPDYIKGTDRYWKCQCNAPYYGIQCQLFDCVNSCNYNGLCLDANICSCYPGFNGTFCQINCGCNSHGSCVTASTVTDGQTCVCDVGYAWSSQNGCVLDTSPALTCAQNCNNGNCLDGKCVCWAGFAGSNCNIPIDRPNINSTIGSNLAGISYYTTQWAFVDAMKMSSSWISLGYPSLAAAGPWGNGMPISLRSDGYPSSLYPGQILVKLMLRDVNLHAPAGHYVCLYDGDGQIDFIFDATTLTSGKGRVEFSFKPTMIPGCTASYCSDNGILLRLLATNPSNPVRNIRILMPGFEHTHDSMPFHPYFLKNLEHYSVLRFMDWQNTNGNNESAWNHRVLPTSDSQAGGVALEHMIQLSNQLGANPWFCIPHRASNDYVTQFAQMLKNTLRHDLKIYIEYSNEVWNTLFPQGSFAQQQGMSLGLSTVAATAGYRFYSQRSVQIFGIFTSVFQNTGVQIVNVLSTWTISTSATTEILTWGNAYQHASVVAVAPYFDCGGLGSSSKAASTSIMTTTQVFAACNTQMPSIATSVNAIVAIAKKYNLPVTSYEAGQSLVETNVMQYGNSDTPSLTTLFIAVNRDSRMTATYVAYINALISTGAVSHAFPMMHFSSVGLPTKYGSWGAIEFTGQPIQSAPKYLALQQYFHGNNSVRTSHVCTSGCFASALTTSVLALGVGDQSFMGFPAVVSPRMHDVWYPGYLQTIRWDPSGASLASVVSLYLWKSGAFASNSVELLPSGTSTHPQVTQYVVQVIAVNVLQSVGSYAYSLPNLPVDGSANYYIEIRGAIGTASNFSEYFTIQPAVYFDPQLSWHCCFGHRLAQFSGTCLQSAQLNYQFPLLQPSNWLSANQYSKCRAYTGFPTSSCSVDTNGCRNYRTLANGKPVMDCTAQSAAFPRPANFSWLIPGNVLPGNDQCHSSISTAISHISLTSCNKLIGSNDTYCLTSQFAPTRLPTAAPTMIPTAHPSIAAGSPTPQPSVMPTREPSVTPTLLPTVALTRAPTMSVYAIWSNHLSSLMSNIQLTDNSVVYANTIVASSSQGSSSCTAWLGYVGSVVPTSTKVLSTVQLFSSASLSKGLSATNCTLTTSSASSTFINNIFNSLSAGANSNYNCDGHMWTARQCFVGHDLYPAICVDCDNPCQPTVQQVQTFNPCGTANQTQNMIQSLVLDYKLITPSPAIHNFTVVPGMTNFQLGVRTSGPGTVVCIALPTNSTPPSSVDAFNAQNNRGIITKNFASVTIGSVSPATNYDIYCTTQGLMGQRMSLSDSLMTRTSYHTHCCKSINVRLNLVNIGQGFEVVDAVTIAMDFPPSVGSLSLTLTTVASATYEAIPMIPALLNVFGGMSTVSASLGWSNTLTAGETQVIVALQGPSSSEYVVNYFGNVNSFFVTPASAVPPIPVFQSAVFSDDGGSLILAFDSITNQALSRVGTGSFVCSNLFTFPGCNKAVCQWTSLASISAQLGPFAQVQIGSSVSLLPNTTAAACQPSYSAHECNLFKFVASTPIAVAAAIHPMIPVVAISTPSTVTVCDVMTIDLSQSTGSGGRAWSKIMFTVSGSNSSASHNLANYLNLNFVISPPTNIPSYLLVVGSYGITVSLTNFLGGSAQQGTTVTITNNIIPKITMFGPSILVMKRSASLQIDSDALVTLCHPVNGSAVTRSGLLPSWTITSGTGYAVPNMASYSKQPYSYKLLPNLLSVNVMYTISLTVVYAGSSRAAQGSVQVFVQQGAIVSVISGGSSQSMKLGGNLTLDASKSFDEDYPAPDVSQSTLQFAWNCLQVLPVMSVTCDGLILPQQSMTSTLNLVSNINYPVSASVVSVVVFDGTRSSQSSVTVTIIPPTSPLVTITSSVTTKVNIDDKIVLSGSVDYLQSGVATWSVDNTLVNLQSVSLSPLKSDFWMSPGQLESTQTFNLVIPPNSLPPGVTLVFSLSAVILSSEQSSSQITIVTNSPPLLGLFIVTPLNGIELSTLFTMSDTQWQDSDLPLTYSFGYINAGLQSASVHVVQSRAQVAFGSTMLPAGLNATGFVMTCVTVVYDSLNASSNMQFNVVVVPLTNTILQSTATAMVSAQLSTIDNTKQVLTTVGSALSIVNCAILLPSVCAALNRMPCSTTDNTCGPCQSTSYYGDYGDANTPCVSVSVMTSQLNHRQLSAQCSSSSVCGVGFSCVAGQCQLQSKTCPSSAPTLTCSGHGSCSYVSSGNGKSLKNCEIGGSTCRAQCRCDSGFAGQACSQSTSNFQARQQIRRSMITHLMNLVGFEDGTPSVVNDWLTCLMTLTSRIDELTTNSTSDVVSILNAVITNGVNQNMDYSNLDRLLQIVDTFLSVHVQSSGAAELNMNNEVQELVAVLDWFVGNVVLNRVVAGQGDITYSMANFQQVVRFQNIVDGQLAVTLRSANLVNKQSDSHFVISGYNLPVTKIGTTVVNTAALSLDSNLLLISFGDDFCSHHKCDLAVHLDTNGNTAFSNASAPEVVTAQCQRGIIEQKISFCRNNLSVTTQCNGDYYSVVTPCPYVITSPVCSRVSDAAMFNDICAVTSYSSNATNCLCDIQPSKISKLSFTHGSIQVAVSSIATIISPLSASLTTAPSVEPSPSPSPKPSIRPSPQPTVYPSNKPNAIPTIQPIAVPTQQPIAVPTQQPIAVPTQQPIPVSTTQPIAVPTQQPIAVPTQQPIAVPTQQVPTQNPIAFSTTQPRTIPTQQPITRKPIAAPTQQPITFSTTQPIVVSTKQPIAVPTILPTVIPTPHQLAIPSAPPTVIPTALPPVSSPVTIKPSSAPIKASFSPTTRPVTVSSKPSPVPAPAKSSSPVSVKPSLRPTALPSAKTSAKTSVPTVMPTQSISPATVLTNHLPTVSPASTTSSKGSFVPSRLVTTDAPVRKNEAKMTIKPSAAMTVAMTSKPSHKKTSVSSLVHVTVTSLINTTTGIELSLRLECQQGSSQAVSLNARQALRTVVANVSFVSLAAVGEPRISSGDSGAGGADTGSAEVTVLTAELFISTDSPAVTLARIRTATEVNDESTQSTFDSIFVAVMGSPGRGSESGVAQSDLTIEAATLLRHRVLVGVVVSLVEFFLVLIGCYHHYRKHIALNKLEGHEQHQAAAVAKDNA